MRNILKWAIVPLGILLAAGLLVAGMVKFLGQEVPRRPYYAVKPQVEWLDAIYTSIPLKVRTQGTVTPRTETKLIPQVSGQITQLSDFFYAGGFFEKGDLLLKLEDSDYQAAYARAVADLAQREVSFEQEKAQAEQARLNWKSLGQGSATALTLREPQLRQAQANLDSATAAVEKAKRDLERTEIRAPYDGMVKEKEADLGQYVSPGSSMGTIFAVDFAEVRLPVTQSEYAFVDVKNNYGGNSATAGTQPDVKLHAKFAGKELSWSGKIVRSEGTVDSRSRMIFLVAKIEDPYARVLGNEYSALKMGTFVNATIEGVTLDRAVQVPRYALLDKNSLLVITSKSTLAKRTVAIAYGDADHVYLLSGLEEGDKICTTILDFYTEGMEVTLAGAEPEEGAWGKDKKPGKDKS